MTKRNGLLPSEKMRAWSAEIRRGPVGRSWRWKLRYYFGGVGTALQDEQIAAVIDQCAFWAEVYEQELKAAMAELRPEGDRGTEQAE